MSPISTSIGATPASGSNRQARSPAFRPECSSANFVAAVLQLGASRSRARRESAPCTSVAMSLRCGLDRVDQLAGQPFGDQLRRSARSRARPPTTCPARRPSRAWPAGGPAGPRCRARPARRRARASPCRSTPARPTAPPRRPSPSAALSAGSRLPSRGPSRLSRQHRVGDVLVRLRGVLDLLDVQLLADQRRSAPPARADACVGQNHFDLRQRLPDLELGAVRAARPSEEISRTRLIRSESCSSIASPHRRSG